MRRRDLSEAELTICRNIRKYRKEAGLSQGSLAGLIGITQGAVSQWEKEIVAPSYDTVVKIAGALRLAVSALAGTFDMPPHKESLAKISGPSAKPLISVEKLSMLQAAAVEAFGKLLSQQLLSDEECLSLLNAWQKKLQASNELERNTANEQ